MLLLALEEATHIAAPLAGELGMSLAPLEDRTFEDGEGKIRPLISVRGKDVYIIQSLYSGAHLSVHDRLCRMLFLIAAVRDHGAARITAVTPYLCYARKDRRTKPRDPLTLRYVAQLIEAVGCDRIVTLEVHNLMAFQNAFRCQTAHVDLDEVFGTAIASEFADSPLCVMSPDPGGIKRAQLFREALEARLNVPVGFSFLDKRRSANVRTEGALSGEVAGMRVIIVDDIIATGGTILSAATACRDRGATDCIALAAHGLFSPGSSEVLQSGALSQILVTNSVPCGFERPRIISCAAALAEAIRRLRGPSHQ